MVGSCPLCGTFDQWNVLACHDMGGMIMNYDAQFGANRCNQRKIKVITTTKTNSGILSNFPLVATMML